MKTAVAWCCCALALVFPFSIAASNALLGTLLGLGLIGGMWWKGAGLMWREHRAMTMAMLAYWGLMLAGLLWSLDRRWGLNVMGHQWLWLAVPVLVALFAERQWRVRMLLLLSVSLTLHLAYCVLQMFGIVYIPDFGGSNANDATGYIGHIGFGFIYGIWAGWLLNLGWQRTGAWRWVLWLLALWAWVMIFAAQGRGGYLVALLVIAAVVWRNLLGAGRWSRLLPLVLLVMMIGLLSSGPGKQRLVTTWHELTAMGEGDVRDANPRLTMWIVAVHAWQNHPLLGVGTGGFPDGSLEVIRQHPSLEFKNLGTYTHAHPHNMYLFSLARWGLAGLAAFTALVVVWLVSGWRRDWRADFDAPLLCLSGMALALDGCFAPTMEQHGTGSMLVLMLGIGLAAALRGNADRAAIGLGATGMH